MWYWTPSSTPSRTIQATSSTSCTKSITGTLIGIAIDQGLLAGVDVPVVEILADAAPETVGNLKASLTVEDLLTMSTGLDCRDSYLHEWQGMRGMQASDDWTAHVLGLPMAEEPGTRFEYCNGSSFLLSAILSEVTGQPASEFATDALFGPLGITEFLWPASPEGITIGWGELVLRPEDMAKFGYLYLRDGEWDGEQLVPQEWVEAATTAQIDAGTLADGYGYQWWIDDAGYVMAQGFGGQHIIVIPDHDLIVTFTSGLVGEKHSRPEELTAEYVVAAVLSDDPLAADLEAQGRLATSVTAARSGPAPSIVEMPAMAATIDGVRYEIRDADSGINSFLFHFRGGSAVFTFDEGSGPTDVQVGLDGRFLIDTASQIALRGTWRGDTTFVVEYQMIGQVERGTVEFIFEDDVGRMTTREPATGTIQTAIADRVG